MRARRQFGRRGLFCFVLIFFAAPAFAQEGALHAALRREATQIGDSCGAFQISAVAGCAVTLATDTPLHFEIGSLPPQNGVGFGAALVFGKATNNWRMNWDMDGVATSNGSWRAGVMMTMARTPSEKIIVVSPPSGTHRQRRRPLFTHPTPVYRLYLQSSAVDSLDFYGLGNDSQADNASVFSMRETIAGTSAVVPIARWPMMESLGFALFGSANARFVKIGAPASSGFPTITTRFTDATAPGLSHQPGFFQATQGLRIAPSVGILRLDYSASLDEFETASGAHNSFLRWTLDLNHTIGLYGKGRAVVSTPRFGPDQCADAGIPCAPISHTRNLSGSVGFEFRIEESKASSASTIPFYFQPTLGGSDINGVDSLPSFADYRFRAPNLLLLRERFEHSIWGPLGFEALADEGRVSLTRSELGFGNLRHSFATGITVRAGGFPLIQMLFSWGSGEGTHTLFGINSTLIGGASRPSYD